MKTISLFAFILFLVNVVFSARPIPTRERVLAPREASSLASKKLPRQTASFKDIVEFCTTAIVIGICAEFLHRNEGFELDGSDNIGINEVYQIYCLGTTLGFP
jgi:hypothetical protein